MRARNAEFLKCMHVTILLSSISSADVSAFNNISESLSNNYADPFRWGVYHPGLYYGIRSRTFPFHINVGFLWTLHSQSASKLFHTSQQGDELHYGWSRHNGRDFGIQEIKDERNDLKLMIHYLNFFPQLSPFSQSHAWGSRFDLHTSAFGSEISQYSGSVSLFLYYDFGCENDSLEHSCRKTQLFGSDNDIFEVEAEKGQIRSCDSSIGLCQYIILKATPYAKMRTVFPSEFRVRMEARVSDHTERVREIDIRFQGFADANVMNVEELLSRRLMAGMELKNEIAKKSTLIVFQFVVQLEEGEDAEALELEDFSLDLLFLEKYSEELENSETKRWDSRIASADSIASVMGIAIVESERALEKRLEQMMESADCVKDSEEMEFSKVALSNLIGGIGYYYGSSLIEDAKKNVKVADPKPLFSASPSRTRFPRGFLWDEGFHQLAIVSFDAEITKQVLLHWFGLMQDDGYIPREIIFGELAKSRVPKEFLVQHSQHANPPTLLLVLQKYLHLQNDSDSEKKAFFELLFPRLERYFDWFMNTQSGTNLEEFVWNTAERRDTCHDKEQCVGSNKFQGFRWRGREKTDRKVNANTLASGLDDYPRAFSPTAGEKHLDLLCWMIRASDIMIEIAKYIALPEQRQQYYQSSRDHFFETLESVHWNAEHQAYFDVGIHSNDASIDVQLIIRCANHARESKIFHAPLRASKACPASHPIYMYYLADDNGQALTTNVYTPKTIALQHVVHIGYVTIFPLLLRVLPADSLHLHSLLMILRDPKHLFSPFGLRSLSKQDLFYLVDNEPGDKAYWRGPIWMNINYLALDALHHYSQQKGPYQALFAETFNELRENVFTNVFNVYRETNFLWEQYNDANGQGQQSFPFSGWTALVAINFNR